MQNLTEQNPVLLREKAVAAYCAGDTEKADLFDALADSLDLIEEQADKLRDAEREIDTRADYSAYKDFFYACFSQLVDNYPCPAVTSDHDCSVIFDAIEKGESNNAKN